MMRAELVSLDVASPNAEIIIESFPATIGRGDEADVRLIDRWVSRAHCEIDQHDGALVVRDLQSRHGTYVDGSRITESRLMPGDKLGIGLTEFVVSYQGRLPESTNCLCAQASSGSHRPLPR